jgi:hypothetical protein
MNLQLWLCHYAINRQQPCDSRPPALPVRVDVTAASDAARTGWLAASCLNLLNIIFLSNVQYAEQRKAGFFLLIRPRSLDTPCPALALIPWCKDGKMIHFFWPDQLGSDSALPKHRKKKQGFRACGMLLSRCPPFSFSPSRPPE